jgi:hypothetical protein
MTSTLTILFRRDPARDWQRGRILHVGYQIFWSDGRPVSVGLDGFCSRGQRLLGLDRALAGSPERLIEILCFPLRGLEDDLTRLPGHRVRRFFLERDGPRGRLYFMNGTATDVVFDYGRDEVRVLDWIGLSGMGDGDRQWLDLAAQAVESAGPAAQQPCLVSHHV